MSKTSPEMAAQISIIRDFNRYYVRRIGLLNGGLVTGKFSLTQLHVLFELSRNDELTASQLMNTLGLDRGYLSRILKMFEAQNLINRNKSDTDGRQVVLTITKAGREVLVPVEKRARDDIADMLAPLSANDRNEVVRAMQTVHRALEKAAKA